MGQLGFFDGKLLAGMGRLAEIAGLMLPPDPKDWAHVRTLLVGPARDHRHLTARHADGGGAGAAASAFLAARNITAQRVVRFMSRRSLDTIRSVDILVWALIWVNVVGLGPFAGALAIMTADIGTFGKLFSEAIEAADRKPVEGIVSTRAAASFGRALRHHPGSLSGTGEPGPLLLPDRTRGRPASSASSAPAASVSISPRRFVHWSCSRPRSSFSMILVTVALIDYVSGQLRFAVIGRRGSGCLSVESVVRAALCALLRPSPEEGWPSPPANGSAATPRPGQAGRIKPMSAFTAERLAEITADPRLYGFHGTLKAPIALADGVTERDLLEAAGNFAVGATVCRSCRR